MLYRPAAKINKIDIKTSDNFYAATNHQVGIEICSEDSNCCKLEPPSTEGWNYFAKKAKTSEKSENISKAKIVLMFSQNSELDYVDSFCFRKVDLLFCEIISKPRNPRI